VIESAIGRRLNEGEVAHAMHDTGDLDVGGRRVRKVEASRIDADKNIGVVFFKTSLSTGWDCPRAEVMMSFRRAEDHTYIAQLLGRMVRTPLARRIEKDAALNDVHLFLPYFDTGAVESVVASLHNAGRCAAGRDGLQPQSGGAQAARRNRALFAALDELMTYRVNAARAQSPLRRYMAISRSLTIDEIDDDAWGQAKQQIVSGWASGSRRSRRQASSTLRPRPSRRLACAPWLSKRHRRAEPRRTITSMPSSVDIDRLFEEAGRAFSHGLQMEYWRAHADRDALEVKVEAIVLARNAAEMAILDRWPTAPSMALRPAQEGHPQAQGAAAQSTTRSCGWPRPSRTKCHGICRHPSTSSASRPIPSGSATCMWKATGSSVPSWAPGRPGC
jgi:type III restriction enzyme